MQPAHMLLLLLLLLSVRLSERSFKLLDLTHICNVCTAARQVRKSVVWSDGEKLQDQSANDKVHNARAKLQKRLAFSDSPVGLWRLMKAGLASAAQCRQTGRQVSRRDGAPDLPRVKRHASYPSPTIFHN